MPALWQRDDSTNCPARQPSWQNVLGLPELPGVQGHPARVIQHPPLSGTSFKAAVAMTPGDALSIAGELLTAAAAQLKPKG
jgi:hypothetical protein